MWRHPVVVGSDIRMIHPGSSDDFAVSNQSGAPAAVMMSQNSRST